MIDLIKKKLARGFAPPPIQSSGSSESLESLDFYGMRSRRFGPRTLTSLAYR